jgi:hypothetical protein
MFVHAYRKYAEGDYSRLYNTSVDAAAGSDSVLCYVQSVPSGSIRKPE